MKRTAGFLPDKEIVVTVTVAREAQDARDFLTSSRVSPAALNCKHSMRSPRASIYANGQCLSLGNAEIFASQGRGIFWPIDEKRLDTSYPEGRLYVTGIAGAIYIKDVHQCPGFPLHWEFFVA